MYLLGVPWFCFCFEPLWCSWVCKRLWMSVLVWSRTPVWRQWHPATTWSGTRHWAPQGAPGWSQCQIRPPSGRQARYPQRRLHSALGWTDGLSCMIEGRVYIDTMIVYIKTATGDRCITYYLVYPTGMSQQCRSYALYGNNYALRCSSVGDTTSIQYKAYWLCSILYRLWICLIKCIIGYHKCAVEYLKVIILNLRIIIGQINMMLWKH